MTNATKSILVATDFSDAAAAARSQAFGIAMRTRADVTLLHVVVPPETWDAIVGAIELGIDNKKLLEASVDGARTRLLEMAQLLKDENLAVHTRVEIGQPEVVIPKLASALEADLVCVGTHGYDASERLGLGSVAAHVMRHAECNVLMARARSSAVGGYRRILVPTDFTELAEAALERAVELVAPDGTIDVAHWWHTSFSAHGYYASFETPVEYREHVAATVAERGQELVAKFRDRHPAIEFSSFAGSPSKLIPGYLQVEDRYDLVVMGSHGRRGIRRLLLGSVAEKVVRNAPCSVMVVHRA